MYICLFNNLYKLVGHFANVCPEAERLCYNCKQPGHYSADCTTPKVVEPKQCFNCGGGIYLKKIERDLGLMNIS